MNFQIQTNLSKYFLNVYSAATDVLGKLTDGGVNFWWNIMHILKPVLTPSEFSQSCINYFDIWSKVFQLFESALWLTVYILSFFYSKVKINWHFKSNLFYCHMFTTRKCTM